MPDWSYQTVFRPTLLRLGARTGHRIALGFMGTLARMPAGKRVIQFMGHMKPDSRLQVERGGFKSATRVGLGHLFDPTLMATRALAEFGVGFLEVGPVRSEASDASSQPFDHSLAGSSPIKSPINQTRHTIERVYVDDQKETIRVEPPVSLSPSIVQERLVKNGPFRIPVLARIEPTSANDAQLLVEGLRSSVNGVVIAWDELKHLTDAIEKESGDEATHEGFHIFVAVNSSNWEALTSSFDAKSQLLTGIVVECAPGGDFFEIGKVHEAATLETIQRIRKSIGPELPLIASVGIHSPADALDCLAAGADFVQVDSGLVFAGPGLPKRINEAVLYHQLATTELDQRKQPTRVGQQAWFWAMLMGLSMGFGGVLAMVLACTRVVLPYDEMISGLSREQLLDINSNLLAFMTHDRVTLAGTMLSVGVLYSALAWFGIRRGIHWAYVAVIASAFSGFFSFFSFLGFGYFDPFHAFVTAILFQFLLLTIHADLPRRKIIEPPNLFNDRSWKANQWGQLCFVIHGIILIVAGTVISFVAMSTVFVEEDLEFMHTSAAELFWVHPQLVPLVAHDRATFGGMLIACGVVTLLPALWGFQRGQAWLWWALLIGGNAAYVSTILVHWTVGYDSLKHLLPAYGGIALLWIGCLASYGFLVKRDVRLENEWAKRMNGETNGEMKTNASSVG